MTWLSVRESGGGCGADPGSNKKRMCAWLGGICCPSIFTVAQTFSVLNRFAFKICKNNFSRVAGDRKVDIRLPGKGNPNFYDARLVYQNNLDDYVDSDQ